MHTLLAHYNATTHLSCMCTGAAVLRALHEAGAGVLSYCQASNGRSNGRTPLFCAALGGHLGALEFLIELAQYTGRIDVVNTADSNRGKTSQLQNCAKIAACDALLLNAEPAVAQGCYILFRSLHVPCAVCLWCKPEPSNQMQAIELQRCHAHCMQ
jgi:hypothetical protein